MILIALRYDVVIITEMAKKSQVALNLPSESDYYAMDVFIQGETVSHCRVDRQQVIMTGKLLI